MRFGFITSVSLGVSCLEELIDLDANLVYLGTLHDDLGVQKSGRAYLDDIAAANDIPVHKFRNVNDADALEGIRVAELDWLFIIGWSQIARQDVLSLPRRGVVGIHPTLLPTGRGRASIPWAIIKRLPATGVSMFKLDEGTDTGPLIGQLRVPITEDETSETLYTKVATAHRQLVREYFPSLADDSVELVEQDHSQATEWPERRPEDGELDPATMSVDDIDRMVRALTRPYPGAFLRQPDGILRIWAGSKTSSTAHAPVVEALDGTYCITDYELEEG